jgi:hypothetical protein
MLVDAVERRPRFALVGIELRSAAAFLPHSKNRSSWATATAHQTVSFGMG